MKRLRYVVKTTSGDVTHELEVYDGETVRVIAQVCQSLVAQGVSTMSKGEVRWVPPHQILSAVFRPPGEEAGSAQDISRTEGKLVPFRKEES